MAPGAIYVHSACAPGPSRLVAERGLRRKSLLGLLVVDRLLQHWPIAPGGPGGASSKCRARRFDGRSGASGDATHTWARGGGTGYPGLARTAYMLTAPRPLSSARVLLIAGDDSRGALTRKSTESFKCPAFNLCS